MTDATQTKEENDKTYAVSLTTKEITTLIVNHSYSMTPENIDETLERMSYLAKRLKTIVSKSEPEEKQSQAPATTAATNEVKPAAQGWGAPSNG